MNHDAHMADVTDAGPEARRPRAGVRISALRLRKVGELSMPLEAAYCRRLNEVSGHTASAAISGQGSWQGREDPMVRGALVTSGIVCRR
jgi:hypothetical protein